MTVVSAGTGPDFELDAVRGGGGATDRWTISHANIDSVFDTSVDGIKGYSVFNLLFD